MPKFMKKAYKFQTPLGGGPQSVVRWLRASILKAFGYRFILEAPSLGSISNTVGNAPLLLKIQLASF